MRNSLKLLIGLAMPCLALAAFYLWNARRQESNHGNDTDVARELRGVAEELKNITNDTRKMLDNSKQYTSVNSTLERAENLSDVTCTQGELLETCTENSGLLESSNASNTKSSEFCRNTQIGTPDESFTGLSRRSNSFTDNGSSQDSEKTSTKNERITSSPKDQSKTRNNNGYTEFAESPCDDQGSQTPSSSEDTISKVDRKAPNVRAQSLDESSDVSSADSKTELPMDQNLSSTAGSDCEPSQPEDGAAEEITWELEFPQALCGRLIGKKGKNVQKISQVTGSKIRLIPQKENTESSQRLVALTGSPKQLKLALKALREKFPGVPFTRLNDSQPFAESNHVSPIPNIVCVALPENELCQVFVTNIVDANHFYVQLYDHSVHTHLRQLDQQIYQCYGGVASTMVPPTINTGMLCAAPSPSGWWWRAQVVGLLMKPSEVEITWLDYGGRTTVPTAMLRQLRYVE